MPQKNRPLKKDDNGDFDRDCNPPYDPSVHELMYPNSTLTGTTTISGTTIISGTTTVSGATTFLDGTNVYIGPVRGDMLATQTYVMGLIGTDSNATDVNIGTGANVAQVNIGAEDNSTDVIIRGKLLVTGGATIVSSTNTVYSDTLLGLQNGLTSTDTPEKDSGLIINRGSENNAFIGFDEDVNKFRMGYTASGADSDDNNLVFTNETATLLADLEGNVSGNVTGNIGLITPLVGKFTRLESTSLSGLTTALTVEQGGTGAKTAPLARTNLGLGNVDNTSDANKPVSTATSTALGFKANLASPTFTGTVAGITKAMVGLGNVDNTSDTDKPVSTATATAIKNAFNAFTIGNTDYSIPTTGGRYIVNFGGKKVTLPSSAADGTTIIIHALFVGDNYYLAFANEPSQATIYPDTITTCIFFYGIWHVDSQNITSVQFVAPTVA